jgi:hypothetical protein
MYTIDEFIERLVSLRALSSKGGATPVVIASSVSEEVYENAAIEIRSARENVDVEGGCVFVESSNVSAEPVVVVF